MQMKRMISMAMAAVAALCLSWNAGAFHGNPEKIKAEKKENLKIEEKKE